MQNLIYKAMAFDGTYVREYQVVAPSLELAVFAFYKAMPREKYDLRSVEHRGEIAAIWSEEDAFEKAAKAEVEALTA